MRRVLIVGLVVVGGLGAAACSKAGPSTAPSTTTVTANISACSAIDNQVLGRYRSLSVAQQNQAGEDLVRLGEQATDPTLVREAKVLEKAAAVHDLSGMDAALGKLAVTCNHLGYGPKQVAPLAKGR